MKKLSLQNRIAANVIGCSALLTMVLCAVILIVFKLHTDKLGAETEITMDNVRYLFLILLRVCCIGVFFTLLLLFAISRKVAYNTTKPIREIINIANTITHNNLSARIPLPNHKDELYELSETINNLLDRIEYAVEREKSFTSYASHEFRTPLSVLKGTMEVLIRKPRTEAEYKEKIGFCIKEVDKLSEMVEQLLILTRYEERKSSLNYGNYPIEDMVNNSVSLYCDMILSKQLEIKTSFSPQAITIYTDENLFSTILNNLISNAVKYSNEKGIVDIKAEKIEHQLILEISNTGIGIPKDEMGSIFENFYRSYATGQPNIKGFGLGLPIVKRFCSLLNIRLEMDSELNKNTIVKLTIPLEE